MFAELHCTTAFTFLTGASRPEELVERAAELGYQALAITDECSLAGVVRAHQAARNLTEHAARRVFLTSLHYHPLLLCLMLFDTVRAP